jgi:hypothetical protein
MYAYNLRSCQAIQHKTLLHPSLHLQPSVLAQFLPISFLSLFFTSIINTREHFVGANAEYLSMKNSTYREHELRKRIKTEGATWVAQQQFWLFGTAKYFDGTEIHERKAHKDIRHYFNTIDKAILRRRDYEEGRRIQRLVFIERGKTRTNTHFHFFKKGTHLRQYRTIWHTAEANWTRHIQGADSILIQDNIK